MKLVSKGFDYIYILYKQSFIVLGAKETSLSNGTNLLFICQLLAIPEEHRMVKMYLGSVEMKYIYPTLFKSVFFYL